MAGKTTLRDVKSHAVILPFVAILVVAAGQLQADELPPNWTVYGGNLLSTIPTL